MEFLSTLQSQMNMSLIYNLRTGNFIVDSLLSIAFSSFFVYLFSILKNITFSRQAIRRFILRKKIYTLTLTLKAYILHDKCTTRRGYSNADDHTNTAYHMTALRLFMNEKYKEKIANYDFHGLDNESEGNEYEHAKGYKFRTDPGISSTPIIYEGHEIWVYFSKTNQSSEKEARETETETVTLQTEKSVELLDKFVKAAYSYYVEKIYKEYDVDDIYYYQLRRMTAEYGVFCSFPLKTPRTFNEVYFDQKKELLQVVNDFQNKKGIFGRNHVRIGSIFCSLVVQAAANRV